MREFEAVTYKKLKGNYNLKDENELLEKLEVKGCGRILDVGCGDGIFTKRVYERLGTTEIIGIDNSAQQIEYAQQSVTDLLFKCVDVANYRSDTPFDCVFSFYAFPHMPKSNLKKALQSVKANMQQEGTLFLYTNVCDFDTSIALPEDQEACEIVFTDFGEPWESQINLTSDKEYRKIFEEVGFKVIDDKRQKDGVKIKEYGEMFSWSYVLK